MVDIMKLATLLMVISCSRLSAQMDCLNKYIEDARNTAQYQEAEQEFVKTLGQWWEQGARTMGHMEKCDWKIDAILFNSSRNQALVIVLQIDTNASAKLDYIEIFVGEKNEDRWRFYLGGVPSMVVSRKGRPHTSDQLSRSVRKKVVKGGYYRKGTYEVDDSYISGWFDDEFYWRHEKLLNDIET